MSGLEAVGGGQWHGVDIYLVQWNEHEWTGRGEKITYNIIKNRQQICKTWTKY